MKRICGTETEFKLSIESKDKSIKINNELYEKIINLVLQAMIEACQEFGIPFNTAHEISGVFNIRELIGIEKYFDFSDFSPNKIIRQSEQDEERIIRRQRFERGPAKIIYSHPGIILPGHDRFYIDHQHPEWSTGECASPKEIVIREKAGEEFLKKLVLKISPLFPEIDIFVYKNNCDLFGNSWGYHENYQISLNAMKNSLKLIPYLITRIIYTGAGKFTDDFEISQRAEFFKTVASLDTMRWRGLINLRHEPHCAGDYNRLHIICGDVNRYETATFLKIFTALAVLDLLENGLLDDMPMIASPVGEFKKISKDVRLEHKITCINGTMLTALEIQNMLCKKARDFYGSSASPEILERLGYWQEILNKLATNPISLKNEVEWIGLFATAHQLFRKKQEKEPNCDMVKYFQKLELSYRNIIDPCGLYNKMEQSMKIKRVTTDAEIQKAALCASLHTRAWLASEIMKKFGNKIMLAHWISLTTSDGKNIFLLDPKKGAKEESEQIINQSQNIEELCHELKKQGYAVKNRD